MSILTEMLDQGAKIASEAFSDATRGAHFSQPLYEATINFLKERQLEDRESEMEIKAAGCTRCGAGFIKGKQCVCRGEPKPDPEQIIFEEVKIDTRTNTIENLTGKANIDTSAFARQIAQAFPGVVIASGTRAANPSPAPTAPSFSGGPAGGPS